ncbi:alpha/beta hydrolase fold protein [Haloterrigena turkmenica DSM 5511]|uniref:Alpha/beta hydrolase fold protein n=1 Tax=Haloterrigena turkmenica (strain ATCC 51198 / DSM 5511 / JCM 9101 / NCIMB 13204 / VKM B-1734 / 4k) TaxID=543526 RepID=D2RSW4_HALTV|nr:alpha/beta hydrolase [Haloterrigena turkmenica]ADB58938.1 alpha/beta hydrolase fold protein [Haloterrigena turkmenica DSM 5511]
MPTASNGSVSLYYDHAGEGEPVVFVPEAGLGGWLWGWQHAAVAGPYEAVVWDLRGTGRSDAPDGPYALETLAGDLEAVLSACEIRNAHLVGCGLGGTVALEAARTSSRVATLTLFGTAPRGEQFDLEALFAPPDDREALADSLEAGLSAEFLESQPADVREGIVDWRADGDADRAGWEAQIAALEGFDATEWLVEVTQPTQVIHGGADELVSPSAGRTLADGLPRGEFDTLEDAGHLCFVERSRDVNDRLLGFLEAHTDDE